MTNSYRDVLEGADLDYENILISGLVTPETSPEMGPRGLKGFPSSVNLLNFNDNFVHWVSSVL